MKITAIVPPEKISFPPNSGHFSLNNKQISFLNSSFLNSQQAVKGEKKKTQPGLSLPVS